MSEDRRTMAEKAVNDFNSRHDRPFDMIDGTKSYHHARLPILATDCDYEISSFSGVRGVRIDPR